MDHSAILFNCHFVCYIVQKEAVPSTSIEDVISVTKIACGLDFNDFFASDLRNYLLFCVVNKLF